tara:strand:+ start:22 stop:414 length:393 start_codon:yes stop_codon:yes gene_type:complete
MATLTPTLTLTSTDVTGDSLNLSVTDTLALGANDLRKSSIFSPDDVAPGGTKIFSTVQGKSYIYVKNIHASLIIYLVAAADTAEAAAWMELAAGEFAFFPWAGVVDLFANTGDNGAGVATAGLEVMIFEA